MRVDEIPVLLIIYDRFDTTKQVLEVLRKIKTKKLYISCDGPHTEHVKDAVNNCRFQSVEAVNWSCELVTWFQDKNEGPRYGVGKAISRFFREEKWGMVLEHDCVPHLDFFTYCAHFLEAFENDERVMHIGGNSYKPKGKTWPEKSFFSKYNHIWGFATWARAWKHYDVEMRDFPQKREQIGALLSYSSEKKYWIGKLEACYEQKIRSWDYPWTYAIWVKKGLSLLPPVNMVRNVGFGSESLHSKDESHILNNLKIEGITDESMMKVPDSYEWNQEFDVQVFQSIFRPNLWQRIRNRLKVHF